MAIHMLFVGLLGSSHLDVVAPAPLWLEAYARFSCVASFENGSERISTPISIDIKRKGELSELSGRLTDSRTKLSQPKTLVYALDKIGVPTAPKVNAREELYLFLLAITALPRGIEESKPLKLSWSYPGTKFEGNCTLMRLGGLATRVRFSGAATFGGTVGRYTCEAYYHPVTGLVQFGESELVSDRGLKLWFTFSRSAAG